GYFEERAHALVSASPTTRINVNALLMTNSHSSGGFQIMPVQSSAELSAKSLARTLACSLSLAIVSSSALADAPAQRLNPVISLIEQGKPVMGLYAPSNRKPFGAKAADPAPAHKSPADLAKETIAYKFSDFVFDGTPEHNYDESFPVLA